MNAHLFDGRHLADKIIEQAEHRAQRFTRKNSRRPRLSVVVSGSAAAASYLKAIVKACARAQVDISIHRLSPGPRKRTLGLLSDIAADRSVDALLVDAPYPKPLNADDVTGVIPPSKDVEGLTPTLYGLMCLAKTWNQAHELILPPTAMAIALIARATLQKTDGRRAVVVGRSTTVGRPSAHLLTTLDFTVTLAHSQTQALPELCRQADLLVLAAGRPGLATSGWVKKGAVVIDAGVHLINGKLVGDAAPSIARRATVLTPVPGGLGPVTTSCLVLNAVKLAERRST